MHLFEFSELFQITVLPFGGSQWFGWLKVAVLVLMIPRGQHVAAAPWGGADYHEQMLMSEFVFRVFLKEEQHLFGQPLSPMFLLYEFPIDKLYSLSWCSLVRTTDNYIKCSLYSAVLYGSILLCHSLVAYCKNDGRTDGQAEWKFQKVACLRSVDLK